MASSTSPAAPRLWTPDDWNALFGLGTNVLVNLLVMTGLLKFVVGLPDALTFGRILPAVGLMLFAGGSSCEPIPEGPTVDGCRSSDTVPAAGPDDDDDIAAPPVGPGSSSPRKKKIRTVELTVVAQPETLRTTWADRYGSSS